MLDESNAKYPTAKIVDALRVWVPYVDRSRRDVKNVLATIIGKTDWIRMSPWGEIQGYNQYSWKGACKSDM